nr:hypothetical protein [Streptomyces lateritius]
MKTTSEHAWEVRDAYGYHPFEDHAQGRRFRAFLHGRAGDRAQQEVRERPGRRRHG